MSVKDEIFEQPQVLKGKLDSQRDAVNKIAAEIKQRDIKYVFLAARGTSDHAGLYAKYLFGLNNQLPIALAAPSIFSVYQRSLDLSQALVLGISQSGKSPDIVRVLEEGRKQGSMTLAITNEAESPLGTTSEFLLDIKAGKEKAVAATKTYTSELLTIAMLSAALAGNESQFETLKQLPKLAEEALEIDAYIERTINRYFYMDQCVVLGRGFNYATAFEWSLKLKEMTYIVADPYSSADFRHGPIAVVERGFPILAVNPSGAVHSDMLSLLQKLKNELHAELIMISDKAESLNLANTSLKLPENLPEWISPIISIIPAQLFCYHLAKIKEYDFNQPRGLSKVTETM
ncbi:MAG: SIS domain-containing protein [Anaerolineaceae bacterium]|nr:SIS domain-containing protein [Anaerolineaceae bacterium]